MEEIFKVEKEKLLNYLKEHLEITMEEDYMWDSVEIRAVCKLNDIEVCSNYMSVPIDSEY